MNEILNNTLSPEKKYPEIKADASLNLAIQLGFGPSPENSGNIGHDGAWLDGNFSLPPHYGKTTNIIELPDGTRLLAFGSPENSDPAEYAKQ